MFIKTPYIVVVTGTEDDFTFGQETKAEKSNGKSNEETGKPNKEIGNNSGKGTFDDEPQKPIETENNVKLPKTNISSNLIYYILMLTSLVLMTSLKIVNNRSKNR